MMNILYLLLTFFSLAKPIEIASICFVLYIYFGILPEEKAFKAPHVIAQLSDCSLGIC
jgi:hypothetical protein